MRAHICSFVSSDAEFGNGITNNIEIEFFFLEIRKSSLLRDSIIFSFFAFHSSRSNEMMKMVGMKDTACQYMEDTFVVINNLYYYFLV